MLDPDGSRFYWMEFEKGNLKSAFLNGSDVRQLFGANIIKHKTSYFSFDVYGDHLYLCYNSQIERIHKLNAGESTVLYNATTDKFQILYALRVFQEEGKFYIIFNSVFSLIN